MGCLYHIKKENSTTLQENLVSQLYSLDQEICQFKFIEKEAMDASGVVYEVSCNDCNKMYPWSDSKRYKKIGNTVGLLQHKKR